MALLSVREAAQRLGVSPALVYGLCSARRLCHEGIGLRRGRIRIPEEAIAEYRRSVTVGASRAVPEPPRPRVRKLHHLQL